MQELRIRVEWSSREKISAGEAAGALSGIQHGLPGLRSSGHGQIFQSLEFCDLYWRRAKGYVGKIQDWLGENGIARSWVEINGQPLEYYLADLIEKARRQLRVAVRRIKSTRRVWPNEQARLEREQMELVLEELDQVTRTE